MPNFYYYIVAEELAENPYTSPPAVTTSNHSLYLNEETFGGPRIDSRGGNIIRERVDS